MELAPEVARNLVRRYAALAARLAPELGERPMVLPTGVWFPDRFQGDVASVERLLQRMQAHAGMDDIPVAVELVGAEPEPSGKSCGACAPAPADDVPSVREQQGVWVVSVRAAELAHPVVLTAGLARSLALVFLVETLLEGDQLEQPLDVTVELAAVLLGFGALMLEAAHVYTKSCGGPNVVRATALSCDELGLAFASFITLRRERPRQALKVLSVTQAEALRTALDWIAAEPGLSRSLATDPALLAADGAADAVLDDPELARLASDLARSRKQAPTHRAPDPARDELRALVDEAFAEASSDVGAERDVARGS